MFKKIQPWSLLLVVIILVVITTPLFGNIYQIIIGRKVSAGWIGSGHPEYFEGFFLSLTLFVPLLLTIFGSSKKYKKIVVILSIVMILTAWLGAWLSLIIDAVAAIISWLIGEVILRAYKALNPTSSKPGQPKDQSKPQLKPKPATIKK